MLIGPDAYSYVFDGQWGYLDYALASSSLTSQVDGVGEWHINADEPACWITIPTSRPPASLAACTTPTSSVSRITTR